MTFDFSGHTAVVTGAGRGIGRGCALALAGRGAHVIAIARSADELATLAQESDGVIDAWPADVTDAELHARISGIESLTLLVNNAGGNRPQAFEEVDTKSLDSIIDLNVRAAFLVAQAATRAMLSGERGGSIVNMSSQMGHVGGP